MAADLDIPSSSTRVLCEHAVECAGCPLIESTYGEQLEIKQERVARAFAHFGSGHLIEPIVGADSIVGYRTRAKLIVSEDGKIGLFAKGGGHRVVDIPNCRVLAPLLARVANTLRAFLRAHADASSLRAIDLREVRAEAEPRVLVTLVADRDLAAPIDRLRRVAEELVRAEPAIVGVAVNFREANAPQILGDETTLLVGVSQAPDTHGRSTHLATFGAFVQAHRGQASRVHDAVARAFDMDENKSARVLDLYGGAGAIALALASTGGDVELVESFPPAVERARQAAKTQKVRLRATSSDAARALRDFAEKNRRFDAVVANPPRRGMSAEARQRLAELAPRVIAYVSCDPDTLARDLDHLSRLGYATDRLQPIDMIPLTEEVETVATLRPANPPSANVLFEDDEIVVVAKEAHEEIKSLEKRVRRLAGAENAVPITSLDRATSGVALFVRRAESFDAWADAMRGPNALIAFVVGCRGITREKGVIARGNRKQQRSNTTRYRRLAIVGGHSLVRVIATHVALRESADFGVCKHLAEIGHPPLGDARFGDARTNRFFEEKHALDRPFVHALRIELDRPTTHERLIVEAPLAGDLRVTLGRLATKEILLRLEEKKALGGGAIPIVAASLPEE